VLQDSESDKFYATGGQIRVPIYITGIIKVGSAEIAVLDSDLGNVETHKTYVSIFVKHSICKFSAVILWISG